MVAALPAAEAHSTGRLAVPVFGGRHGVKIVLDPKRVPVLSYDLFWGLPIYTPVHQS